MPEPVASLPLDVLVVDDESDVRGMLGDFLGFLGCRAVLVATAQQALERLAQGSFHVAIVDLQLPDMDGMTLLSHIREQHRDLALIVLTGFATVRSASNAVRLAVSAYLEKPVNQEQLRGDLEKIARERGLMSLEDEVLHNLGLRIHARRKEMGMKLRDLSQISGISVSMLSQVERAAASLSIANLVRLAVALRVDVRDLFSPMKPRP